MATKAVDVINEEFEVEPYSGDDWAQALARRTWLVMLGMGVMLVLGALAAASFAGLSLADAFSGVDGAADSFGRARSTGAWLTGVGFLGMGFILSSITMVLVNIVRTLRDSGKDVQESLGANEVVKLRKPVEGRLLPHVMMAGLMILLAGVVFGAYQAVQYGSIPADLLASRVGIIGDDLANFGTAEAIGQWVGPLRLVGLATIFGSIVLVLRVIIKTLRFQAFRVTQLIDARGSAEAAYAPVVKSSNGRARPRRRSHQTRRSVRPAA